MFKESAETAWAFRLWSEVPTAQPWTHDVGSWSCELRDVRAGGSIGYAKFFHSESQREMFFGDFQPPWDCWKIDLIYASLYSAFSISKLFSNFPMTVAGPTHAFWQACFAVQNLLPLLQPTPLKNLQARGFLHWLLEVLDLKTGVFDQETSHPFILEIQHVAVCQWQTFSIVFFPNGVS